MLSSVEPEGFFDFATDFLERVIALTRACIVTEFQENAAIGGFISKRVYCGHLSLPGVNFTQQMRFENENFVNSSIN